MVKDIRNGPRPIEPKKEPGAPNRPIRDLVNMIHTRPWKKETGHKRTHEQSTPWKEKQVVFPVVRGGPRNRLPLVIHAMLGHYRSECVFIDGGSSSDIMYEQCFRQLEPEDQARLTPVLVKNQQMDFVIKL